MKNLMAYKLQLTFEALLVFLALNWGLVSSLILGIPGAIYYLAMLKMNVINKSYEGSWKLFIKSIFTL